MNAANAATSIDPVEKMLGILASTRTVATMTPAGEVKSLTGYKEMTNKIMANFNSNDPTVQKIARDRLEHMVGNGLIKNNLDQLFKIFPDSAVHIGDKWKLSAQQKSELNLNTKSTFTLEKIEDGIALVSSKGDISSDSATTNMQGYDVTTNLKGSQEGEYEMDTHTGMLLSARLTANVDGTLNMMGREIPVTVEMKVKMNGQKVK